MDEAIGRRITEARKALGLSKKSLAEGLKVAPPYISALENSRRKVNDRIIKLISLTYGVNETWLKTGEGGMFDEGADPRLDEVISGFKRLDALLQNSLLRLIDDMLRFQEKRSQGGTQGE